MASDEQIRANRENAKRSTGPKTQAGKEAVRYNALTHGLLAKASLLPDENANDFERHLENVQAAFSPVGEREQLLVDRIASSLWRLRRVVEVEAGVFVWYRSSEIAEGAGGTATYRLNDPAAPLNELIRESEALEEGDALREEDAATLKTLRETAAQRFSEAGRRGAAFVRDAKSADVFPKVSRYEANIERGVFRALDELERLQSARLGTSETSPDEPTI